jgi:transcriptional regulator with PAS, ATPase and Fis domain
MNSINDTKKFLDELDDSRLDPRLRAILDEIDSSVMADDYNQYLERNSSYLSKIEGLSREEWYRTRFDKLMEKERSRRAQMWNSSLTCCTPSDYRYPEKEGFRTSEII